MCLLWCFSDILSGWTILTTPVITDAVHGRYQKSSLTSLTGGPPKSESGCCQQAVPHELARHGMDNIICLQCLAMVHRLGMLSSPAIDLKIALSHSPTIVIMSTELCLL